MVWRKKSEQPQHSLKPNPKPQQALTLFNFRTAAGGEEATEKFEVCRGWFLRSKRRSHVLN